MGLAVAGELASQPTELPKGDERGCSLVIDGPKTKLKLYLGLHFLHL